MTNLPTLAIFAYCFQQKEELLYDNENVVPKKSFLQLSNKLDSSPLTTVFQINRKMGKVNISKRKCSKCDILDPPDEMHFLL